jgi:rhodanese-related sulfurtransferase
MGIISSLFDLFSSGAPVREVSVQDAFAMQKEGWTLVDVRSPNEFALVRAEGAVNLPLDQVSAESVRKRCPNKKALMICQGGVRSGNACKQLSSEAGLEVVSVHGGTSAWSREGLPVVADKHE